MDQQGYSALQTAAMIGNRDVIHLLLCFGADVNGRTDMSGNTCLHEVACRGFSKSLELLCHCRANPNIPNKEMFTPLHLAAQHGHNQSVRFLIYAGCDVNAANRYGDTALHTATRYGHISVVRILLTTPVCMDAVNRNGDNALHIAVGLRRLAIAHRLVEANMEARMVPTTRSDLALPRDIRYMRNAQNETALEVAIRKQYDEFLAPLQQAHLRLCEPQSLLPVRHTAVFTMNVDGKSNAQSPWDLSVHAQAASGNRTNGMEHPVSVPKTVTLYGVPFLEGSEEAKRRVTNTLDMQEQNGLYTPVNVSSHSQNLWNSPEHGWRFEDSGLPETPVANYTIPALVGPFPAVQSSHPDGSSDRSVSITKPQLYDLQPRCASLPVRSKPETVQPAYAPLGRHIIYGREDRAIVKPTTKTLAWLDEEKENLISNLPVARQLPQSLGRRNHVTAMPVRDIVRDRLFPSNRPPMQPFASGEPVGKTKTHSFLSRLFKKKAVVISLSSLHFLPGSHHGHGKQPSDQPTFGLLVKQWLFRSGSKRRDLELHVQPMDQAYDDRCRQRTEHYGQSGLPTTEVLQNQINSNGPGTRMNGFFFHRHSIGDRCRQTVEAVPIPIVRTKSDDSLIQASNGTTTHFGEFSHKFRSNCPMVLQNSSRRSVHYPKSPS
ncbi:ankyrin repeat domain-containing protein 6 [Paragonimus westermani]|uniref:Ankyrin repeat domain-containing protein 6 n=1 Tax=Paragonimus westermani TaxID=34504 RepID=A0A5J4NZJ4_9TREM|nr:ankyrin repeat domain-containing protein 6 [Paragonimus westermani]